jgi:hypothetical protein
MNQHEILTELGKIGAARRGSISEQWYRSQGKDGGVRQNGPYYIWQRTVRGEKRSVRVSREDVARARAELERGQAACELIEQFWVNAEAAAEVPKKRAAGQRPRPLSARNSDRRLR